MKSRKGFTLIELLAVIVIISIIMLIAIPRITVTLEKSRSSQIISDATKFVSLVRKEVNNGNIEKPGLNGTIRITLDSINTTDVEHNADGVPYDKIRSYVELTRTENNKFACKVNLVSKNSDDKTYTGILNADCDDLALNLVKKDLLINDLTKLVTITFDATTNGGQVYNSKGIAEYNSEIELPNATKSGWNFIGWNTNKTATTGFKKYQVGETDVTLYAIFKKDVRIVFNANNNTISKTSDSCTIWNSNKGCSIISPTIEANINTPEIIGFSTSKETHNNEWGSNEVKEVSKSQTYFAQTKTVDVEIPVTYLKGVGVDRIEDIERCLVEPRYNGDITPLGNTCSTKLPTIVLNRGYHDPIWTGNKEIGTVVEIAEPTTFTSSGTINTSTLIINDNGGTGGVEITKTYNEVYNITLPTKEGFVLKDFSVSDNCETLNDLVYTFPDSNETTCTLKANWDVQKYTITFDAGTNRGYTDAMPVSLEYGDSITLPTATREGYEFLGWSKDSDSHTALKNYVMENENITLYAIFKKVVNISFANNNNTISKTSDSCTIWNNRDSCTIKAPVITAPANTPVVVGFSTRPNYDSTDSFWESNTNKSFSKDDDGLTYYAYTKKGAISYQVTFIYGSGVVSTPTKVETCTINETYNGTAQAASCGIDAKDITPLAGYHTPVWNNVISPGTTLYLTQDTTLTATAKQLDASEVSYTTNKNTQVKTVADALNDLYIKIHVNGGKNN